MGTPLGEAATHITSVDESQEPEYKYPWEDSAIKMPHDLLLKYWVLHVRVASARCVFLVDLIGMLELLFVELHVD